MFEDPATRPRTLHEWVVLLEESVHEIRLQCVQCKKELQRREVYKFLFTDLRIVYRDNNPYGVCIMCLRFLSKISEYRHYQYSLYGKTLEERVGKPLSEITIRCIICQTPLCPEEKERHVNANKRFHNIMGRWTGRCSECWRPRPVTQV
uniref:Protein E6 n=1 Tax=Human papillomavirus 52 TaxID=10618 RepID=A0A7L8YA30_HPV52|nr:E6 [human papillomavirus 52]